MRTKRERISWLSNVASFPAGIDRCIMILRGLRLPEMANELNRQKEDPNSGLKNFEERLGMMIDAEYDARFGRKLSKYISSASLKFPDAVIDNSIYDTERKLDTETISALASCEWIEHGRNLLITGETGTGKTYLACAFAVSAMTRFYSAYYTRCEDLIKGFERARYSSPKECNDFMTDLSNRDLLILDDFGLMNLDLDACRDLLSLIDARNERRPTIVISQFPSESWFSMFSNNTYADACLDRLVKGAYRIEMHGKSLRGAPTR